jgi:phosphohistidine phosphatase SixA
MIIFALRHADRTAGDDLSPAGQRRAELLARMLGETGVSIVYRSDAIRAVRTVEPLKVKLGASLTIEEVGFPVINGIETHILQIVERIKALPARTVLAVVSHSNTVGPILEGLGSEPVDQIKDTEFDKLFVLFIDATGCVALTTLRYGN